MYTVKCGLKTKMADSNMYTIDGIKACEHGSYKWVADLNYYALFIFWRKMHKQVSINIIIILFNITHTYIIFYFIIYNII